MKIGLNIKKYRKEKGLSQETLAERIGVSFQAVSRWERGESYPDITLLPSLASFFEVTVDELLGVNEFNEKEEVKKIIEELGMCEIKGNGDRMCELASQALVKYPGNYEVMAWYTYSHININPEKSLEVGLYLLDNCTDNSLRNWTNRNIVYAYRNLGQLDKAVELANELPSYYDSSLDVLTNILQGEDKKIHVQKQFITLAYECWYGVRAIRYFYSPAEQLELFKKSNAIYDAIYERDDMPEALSRKASNYQGMFECAMEMDQIEDAIKYLECAVECAIIHDDLPMIVESENLLFNTYPYQRQYEYETNLKQMLIGEFETEELYDKLRDNSKFKELLDTLKK